MSLKDAFQSNAFQTDAFQVTAEGGGTVSSVSLWWEPAARRLPTDLPLFVRVEKESQARIAVFSSRLTSSATILGVAQRKEKASKATLSVCNRFDRESLSSLSIYNRKETQYRTNLVVSVWPHTTVQASLKALSVEEIISLVDEFENEVEAKHAQFT